MMTLCPPLASWQIERSVRTQLDVAVLVYQVRNQLVQAGSAEPFAARVATVVSELATNIVRYAGLGMVTVVCRQMGQESRAMVLEVVAMDRGPGIADVAVALRERHSTGGSLGLGLSAVGRMADDLRVASQPGQGTTVTARFWL
jgi:serine/threonine-protein kinase RsbT